MNWKNQITNWIVPLCNIIFWWKLESVKEKNDHFSDFSGKTWLTEKWLDLELHRQICKHDSCVM